MTAPEFSHWLAQFSATGDICPVRLGMKRDELIALFGDPDARSGKARKHPEPAILVYRDLEFHFDVGGDGELFLIYRDNADGIVEISIKRGFSD